MPGRMTTVWHRNAAEVVPAWVPTLIPTVEDQLDRARQILGENARPSRASADEAIQALRQASDALMAVLLEYGVETPLGWRLHQLRSRLDSHLLAANALAEADALDAVTSVLRRTLSFIGPELEALSADALQ
jgi:hypothetical protein